MTDLSERPHENEERQRRRVRRDRQWRKHREVRRGVDDPDPGSSEDLVPDRRSAAGGGGDGACQREADDHDAPREPDLRAVAFGDRDACAYDDGDGAGGEAEAEEVDAGRGGRGVFAGLVVDGEVI